MSRKTSRNPWWVWLLMGVWMLGCGNLLGVVQSAQQVKGTVEALATQMPATVEAAATALPPATQAAPPSADTSAASPAAWARPDDAATVQTYRARWEYTFTLEDTGETIPLVQVEWAVNKAQNAEQMKLISPTQSLEIIRVGSQAWLYQDQVGWMLIESQAQSMATFDAWTLWEDTALQGAGVWQSLGTETVEGMETVRYRWTVPQALWAANVESWVQDWGLGAAYTLQPAGDGHLDAWVTPEGWLARIAAQWPLTATDNAGTTHPASLRWAYTVWDVNATVDIQPPEVNTNEAPLPLPPGAQVRSATPGQGLWIYLVPDTDLAGVQAFYREQAQAGAFRLEGEVGGLSMGFWQATAVLADGARWRIMASLDAGGVTVMIQKP